jgi:hypothetical protein
MIDVDNIRDLDDIGNIGDVIDIHETGDIRDGNNVNGINQRWRRQNYDYRKLGRCADIDGKKGSLDRL